MHRIVQVFSDLRYYLIMMKETWQSRRVCGGLAAYGYIRYEGQSFEPKVPWSVVCVGDSVYVRRVGPGVIAVKKGHYGSEETWVSGV